MSASARDEKSWAVASVIWMPEPEEPAAAEPLPRRSGGPRAFRRRCVRHVRRRTVGRIRRRIAGRGTIVRFLGFQFLDLTFELSDSLRIGTTRRGASCKGTQRKGKGRRGGDQRGPFQEHLCYLCFPHRSSPLQGIRNASQPCEQHHYAEDTALRQQNVTILTPYGKRSHPHSPKHRRQQQARSSAANPDRTSQPGSNTLLQQTAPGLRPTRSRRHSLASQPLEANDLPTRNQPASDALPHSPVCWFVRRLVRN